MFTTIAGTFPVISLMVGTAVLRLSNCAPNDASGENVTGSDGNSTTNDITCENDPVDIAVTLALLVGIFMVSVYSKYIASILLC